MASQNERSTRNTTPTQSQLDSLAAFLSDWSEDSDSVLALAQTLALAGEAEEEKETEDVQTPRSSLLLQEHPPPAAYDLPSGALRRRSSYMSSTSTGTGAGDGEHNHHEHGDGAMASMAILDSLATNPLPILPLPFATLREQRQMDQEAPSPLHQEVTANVPSSSALMLMSLDNEKESSASARLGGDVGGILPLPPPPSLTNPRPIDHRVGTDTSEGGPSSSSTSTSSTSVKARPPAA